MRKSLQATVLLLTSCLLSTAPAYAEDEALIIAPEQQKSMGLQTADLLQVEAYPSANYSARAMIPLNKRHQLSAPLSGKIVALNYVHGDVEVGEVVAELESPEYLQMQQQTIAVLADLEVAKQNLKRAEALSKSGTSSVKNLNSIRAEVTKLQAEKQHKIFELQLAGMNEKSLSELLKTQKTQSPKLQVVSHVKGQVYDLEVKINQYVEAGQVLVSLGETDPIVFEAYVSKAVSTQLHEGQAVKFPQLNIMGEIAHIHSEVDEITQTIDVHIRVANPDRSIIKGQLNQIQFLNTKPVYQVSASALSQLGTDKIIFVDTDKGIESVLITVQSIVNDELFFTVQIFKLIELRVCL